MAVLILSSGPVATLAQTCPQYAPSGGTIVTASGCGSASNPCPVGQPITLTIVPSSAPGQSCDTITWFFGDSTTATTNGNYSTAHTYAGANSSTYVSAKIQNSLGTNYAYNYYLTIANGFIILPTSAVTAVENSGAAHVQVQRSTSAGSVSVNYSTSNYSAIAGYRYVATSGTLTFSPGETIKTIDIPLIDNSVYDGDQAFNLNFSGLTNGYLLQGYSSSIAVTIKDDELPPSLAFSSNTYRASERDGSVTITVNRSGDLTRTVSVNYGDNVYSSGGTIPPLSGTLVFQSGETSKSFVIPITDNDFYDGDQTYQLSISNPSGGVLANGSYSLYASLTIADDEPRPVFNVSDISVVEGNSGTTSSNFVISMTGKMRNPTYFYLSGVSGTATSGVDYTLPPSSLTIAAGATSTTFPITIIGDTTVEPNETVVVTVTTTCCGSVPIAGKASGTCTIINDDSGLGPATQTLAVGMRGALLLSVGPPSSMPQVVTLSSSDPTIIEVPSSITITDATLQSTILVTARKAGRATITVTLPPAFGGATLSAQVTAFNAIEIRFAPPAVALAVGESRQVTATADPVIDTPLLIPLSALDPTRVQVPQTITIDASGSATFAVTGLKSGATGVSANVGPAHGNRNFILLVDVGVTSTSPTVAQIFPANGPASGGTTVTLTGTNLRSDCTVRFGGLPAANPVLSAAGSLSVLTPAHVAGVVDVVLSCGDQSFTLSNGFTYLDTALTLAGITPSFGSKEGGTFVRIKGTNLRSGCWPFFDGQPAQFGKFVDTSEMLATTPSHPPGSSLLELRCSGQMPASLTSAFSFTALTDPSAVITSVNPLFGAPGQSIVIAGVRFRPGDAVTIGEVPATILTAAPDGHTVRVPELPLGPASVSITGPNGVISTTGPIFTVTEPRPPLITSLSRTSGPAGAEIQIFGTDFRPAYGVGLGERRMTMVAIVSDRIIARIPEVAPGSYNLNVLNSAGHISTVGPSFTVTSTGLTIANVTPACTTTDGGANVVLTGTGFQAGVIVTFGGVPVSNVTIVDAGTLRLTAPPAAAGDALIQVQNANGETATLTNAFKYYSSFDPNGCAARPHPSRH